MLTLWISIAILVLAGGASALWLGWRVRQIRSGRLLVAPEVTAELAANCQRFLDRFYYQFGAAFKQVVRLLTFVCLLVVHELVVFTKYIMARLEGRFLHLLNLVRGRPVLGRNGAVSPFLSEISYRTRQQ